MRWPLQGLGILNNFEMHIIEKLHNYLQISLYMDSLHSELRPENYITNL